MSRAPNSPASALFSRFLCWGRGNGSSALRITKDSRISEEANQCTRVSAGDCNSRFVVGYFSTEVRLDGSPERRTQRFSYQPEDERASSWVYSNLADAGSG